ncbi:MAG: hypothetical protein AUI16_02175 [Alphaproteobacteria bacterium 13_2_20CM_2_64_7]|jgi:hypothetical protein|nr:MAG: hypothetical protein AUI16_02175 [Alphaproteobacteria bacterium 13_2_20CM_2_64_7]
MAKRHGWLVGALDDAGYQQRDLAKAWKVDDAVVSRFISSGKPDLTPERQMILSQMLGMTNDQLLARLYGGISVPGVIALRPRPQPVPEAPPLAAPPVQVTQAPAPQRPNHVTVDVVIRRCVERLEELLGPGVRVSIHIDFDKRREE